MSDYETVWSGSTWRKIPAPARPPDPPRPVPPRARLARLYTRSLAARVYDALTQPMTCVAIAQAVGCTPIQASKALANLCLQNRVEPAPGPRVGRTVYQRRAPTIAGAAKDGG